ncbi:DUF7344 domain-containing protein [Halomarina litorea]|uniref:DUF7344 domain-containing protein n=1 Tax=Halomarina litorea TaxID=2961595 RepID=UPI0020C39A74|nr:hypothetical protein [Halomarina sp. BCD28]
MDAEQTEDAEVDPDAPDAAAEPRTLPKDELFHLLQNERRRRALQFLRGHEDGVVDMRDMAEHIAALENDVEVVQLTSAQRKRVYVGLYQCHLPKLDEAGVVDYDKNRGTVAQTPLSAQLTPYLAVEAGDVPETEESADRTVRELVDAAGPAGAATVIAAVLTVGAATSTLPAAGLWLPVVLTTLFAVVTLISVLR